MDETESLPMGTQREPDRNEIQHPDRKAQGDEQIENENGGRESSHPGKTRRVAWSGCWEGSRQGIVDYAM